MLNRREMLVATAALSIGGNLLASTSPVEQKNAKTVNQWKNYVTTLPEDHPYRMFLIISSDDIDKHYAEFPLDISCPIVNTKTQTFGLYCIVHCDNTGVMKIVDGDYVRIDAGLTSPIEETINNFIREVRIDSDRICCVKSRFNLNLIGISGEIMTKEENFCIFFNGNKYGLCCFDCRKVDVTIRS